MKTNQMTKQIKNKLYIFAIQDEEGRIVRLMHGTDYEQLWIIGTTESKSMAGRWTIFDLDGRAIDGNFTPKAIR